MTEEFKTEKVEIRAEEAGAKETEGAPGHVTIINDTDTPVSAALNNGFAGPASAGYVAPGQKLELPCACILWDVYVLSLPSSRLIMRWFGAGIIEFFYNWKKSNVACGITIRVSDL